MMMAQTAMEQWRWRTVWILKVVPTGFPDGVNRKRESKNQGWCRGRMELPATEAKKAEGSKCEEGKTMGAVWDTMRCLFNTPVKMFGRKLRAYKRGTEGEI